MLKLADSAISILQVVWMKWELCYFWGFDLTTKPIFHKVFTTNICTNVYVMRV